MILITGMHRSGTTFLSKIINHERHYHSIHEPTNVDFGLVGIKKWYYYGPTLEKNIARIFGNMLVGQMKFKVPVLYSNNIIRRLFKSRGNIDYLKFKYSPKKKELLIKDPFLSLAADYFLEINKGNKVIFIVRHPVAIFESIKRMNWDFDFNQSDLNNIIVDYPQFKSAPISTVTERLSLLWCIINTVIINTNNRYPNTTLIIRHEDLSVKPIKVVKEIYSFLNMEYRENTERFIKSTMFDSTVNPKHKKQFDFKRNSFDLAYSWKKKNDPMHSEIISLTKDTLALFNY
jgi:hypothetical protein